MILSGTFLKDAEGGLRGKLGMILFSSVGGA